MSLNSKTFVMQAAKIFPIRSLDSVQSASQTNGCFWRCLRALMINDYLKISSNWLVHICCQLEEARKSNRPAKYVKDIVDERMKLLERCKIIINMQDSYSTFEKSMTDGCDRSVELEETEYLEIRELEKTLLCAACIELTEKEKASGKSTTNLVYNDHVTHIDAYIKESAKYLHEVSMDIELSCYHLPIETYAKDMHLSVKTQLLTAFQAASKAHIEEISIATCPRTLINSEGNSQDHFPNIENVCSICFEALVKKTSVNVHPCNHHFHRTCALLWFEEQFINHQDDSCPLCRTVISKIIDEHGEPVKLSYPVEKDKQLLKDKVHVPDEDLNATRRVIFHVTRELQRHRMLALKNGRSKEWLADIDEELEKNRKRSVELDNFDLMSFKQRALDKVAESRINSLPADAPDALIDDAAVIDHSSGDDQEDSIIDDGSRIQGSHTALSMELDGGVVNNSDNDADIADVVDR